MSVLGFDLTPIGIVNSPYKQKFSIPRQPGLVKAAKGAIVMEKEFSDPNFFKGITDFSHVWVLFYFHETAEQGYKPLVRPPRLGGNTKVGVFATRSNFRPNSIGMSAVKLDGVVRENGRIVLKISEMDLLDTTPVLDIKPYIAYSDAISNAASAFAGSAPFQELSVTFTESAKKKVEQIEASIPDFELFVTQVLAQDPRPGYKKYKEDSKHYQIRLYDFDILWTINEKHCLVHDIVFIECAL